MKKKTTGPNMSQWKEFRYNLVKESIEIDADNEEEIPGSWNEPDEPFTYQLKNGKTLEIEETDGPGMAGEPMTFSILKVDGKPVQFDAIKSLMDPKDAQELEQYLDEVGGANAASADRWVRESKKSKKYFDVAGWRETQKKSIVKESMNSDILLPNKLYRAIWRNTDGNETDELFLEVGKKITIEQAKKIMHDKIGYPDDIEISNMQEYNAARNDLSKRMKYIEKKLQNLKIKLN